MFNTFDAPSGEACVARRDRSNTPLQSLTLLNDETFLDAARALGRRMTESNGSTEELARDLFYRCLGRPPAPTNSNNSSISTKTNAGASPPANLPAAKLLGTDDSSHPAEQAAWTAVARVLLNLDEAVTKS
jgi:hypothetical protein